MKRIVCEMCESTDFAKENGKFVCQECGCKYTAEDARALMVEVEDDTVRPARKPEPQPQPAEPEPEPEPVQPEYPPHTPDSPNRIFVQVEKVGHETYTAASVSSLSALLGGPSSVFVEGPDEVGHIGAALKLTNLAGDTIKYVTVYLTPYNAVGDPVGCTVQGHSNFGINITGPIEAGESWQGTCDGMWYNNTIVSARITHADVEFMDGTKERFDAYALTHKEKVSSNKTTDETLIPVTVTFDANAGGAQTLWYGLDSYDKIVLPKGQNKLHYLKPGTHVIRTLNPFMKREYFFKLDKEKTIDLYGKSFGIDISER